MGDAVMDCARVASRWLNRPGHEGAIQWRLLGSTWITIDPRGHIKPSGWFRPFAIVVLDGGF